MPCSPTDEPGERALQVALRAARLELAQRDESLARLVNHLRDLQQAADAHEATSRAAHARAEALGAELTALRSSRTYRWGSEIRRARRTLGAWRHQP